MILAVPTLAETVAIVKNMLLVHELAKPKNPADIGAMGKINSMATHWSAGGYKASHPGYGLNAEWWAEKPSVGVLVQTGSTNDKGTHVWGRNTGMFGLAIAAMADDFSTGKKVVLYPKPVQVWTLAYAAACCAGIFGLKIEGTVKKTKMASNDTSIWAIDGYHMAPVLADHAWYAARDGYYPHRWDIGSQLKPDHAANFWLPFQAAAFQFRKWVVEGALPNRLQGWLQ